MRNPNGTFTKGVSGNPRGRPKASITEALRALVDPQAVAQAIYDLALNPAGLPAARLQALSTLVDRVEGRAVSRSEIVAEIRTHDPTDDLTDEELEALEAHETAVLRASASDLLLAGELDVEAAEAEIVLDVVHDGDLTPGSEARSLVPAARPADSRHDTTAPAPVKPVETGPAEVGIAQMAARSKRGRSAP